MAKRKNNQLKIKVAKNNVLYYYLKGKRLKSAEGQKIQAEQFEKRSKAAKKAAANTYKYEGRPIPRIYAVLMQKNFPDVDYLKIMDLSQWTNPATGKPLFDRYSKILKIIDNASKKDSKIFKLLTKMGYFKDKEGRTALIDICEILQQKEYDKFKFILIDEDGDEIRGRIRVCEKLRLFEEAVTTGLKNALGLNVVKTSFDYSPNYDFKKKIFELDIQDQDSETTQNNRFDFKDIVKTSEGELKIKNNQGVSINKFKNVEITYKLS
jgi:hypothetical protein